MTAATSSEQDFLARFFSMGKGSEIISHPPHSMLSKVDEQFQSLKAKGLIIEEPFNQFGVKRITCTDEAAKLAVLRFHENARSILTASDAGRDKGEA